MLQYRYIERGLFITRENWEHFLFFLQFECVYKYDPHPTNSLSISLAMNVRENESRKRQLTKCYISQFTFDLSWQHCAKVFVHVHLVRLREASALPILQRVWMRKILQQDEEVFFDSHLDMRDASVWIRSALRSIKRKISRTPRFFMSVFKYLKLFMLI